MAIASITAWLADPNRKYEHGRLLYEQYGTDKVLRVLLCSGSTSFHFSKLQLALEGLNKLANLEPQPVIIGEIQPSKNSDPLSGFENAPDKILEIRNTKNRRYAQARRLFEAIRVMDSQNHRLEAALELLDHMDYVSEAWQAIDEWREVGKVREFQEHENEAAVSELTLTELLKEANNLPPNISKDRGRLKSAKSPIKEAEIAERLRKREQRLELIRRRLKDELV